MFIPLLGPGMKKRGELTCFRIKTRQIRTFVKVAMMAGQGQVGEIIPATMLAGNDVLDVERNQWGSILR